MEIIRWSFFCEKEERIGEQLRVGERNHGAVLTLMLTTHADQNGDSVDSGGTAFNSSY